MCHVNGIIRIYQQGNIIIHLLLIGIIELIKSGHVLHSTGLYTDFLTLVPSVGEYQFQRAAHIIECRIMPAFRLTGFLRLHTADNIIFPGILQCQSPAHQGRNNHFVIIIGRKPDTRPGQIRRLQQQIMGRFVPHTDREGWLGQKYMLGSCDTHK